MLKKILFIMFFLVYIHVYTQVDPPSGYTSHYRFSLWTQGAKPGATGLNGNWIGIDSVVYAEVETINQQMEDDFNELSDMIDSMAHPSKGYYDFIVQDSVVSSAEVGSVRFFYRDASSSEDSCVLHLSSYYGFKDLSISKQTINQGSADTVAIDDSPYLSPFAYSGDFNVSASTDFSFATGNYTIDFWFYLEDEDVAQIAWFNSINFKIGTDYDSNMIYFTAGAVTDTVKIEGFIYNQWNHVEFSYSASNDSVYAYLNGVLKSTAYFPIGSFGSSTLPLNLNYSENGSLLIENLRFLKGVCLHNTSDVFYPQYSTASTVNAAGMYVVIGDDDYKRLAYEYETSSGGNVQINNEENIIIEGSVGHLFNLSKDYSVIMASMDGDTLSGEVGDYEADASTKLSVYRGTTELQVVNTASELTQDKYYIKDIYVPGAPVSERVGDGGYETTNVSNWLLRYCDIVPGNECPTVYMRMVATSDPNWVITGNYSARITNGGRGYTIWKDNLNLEVGNTYRLRLKVRVKNTQTYNSYIKFFRDPVEDDYTQISGSPTITISKNKGDYLIDQTFSVTETGGYFAIQTGETYFDGVNPPTYYFSDISIDEVSLSDMEGTAIFSSYVNTSNNEAYVYVDGLGKDVWSSYALVTVQMHSNSVNALYMTRCFNIKKIVDANEFSSELDSKVDKTFADSVNAAQDEIIGEKVDSVFVENRLGDMKDTRFYVNADSVTVSDTLDFSEGNVFYKNLSSNLVLKLKNTIKGQAVTLVVENDSTYILSFSVMDAGTEILWSKNTTPTQTKGSYLVTKADVYTFIRVGDKIYATVKQNFYN